MKIFKFSPTNKTVRRLSEEQTAKVRELLLKMNQDKNYPVMHASMQDMNVINNGSSARIPVGKKLSFRVDANTGEISPPVSDANFNKLGKTIDTISSNYDSPNVKKPSIVAFSDNSESYMGGLSNKLAAII